MVCFCYCMLVHLLFLTFSGLNGLVRALYAVCSPLNARKIFDTASLSSPLFYIIHIGPIQVRDTLINVHTNTHTRIIVVNTRLGRSSFNTSPKLCKICYVIRNFTPKLRL